jgi:glucose-1-phosphate adenylyltransferase
MKEKPQKIEDSLTDLYSQADNKSKGMITLDGKRPFLDYLLFNIMDAGLKHVLIIISEKDKSIPEYYGQKETDNVFEKLLISYAIQKIPAHREKPWGTADALYQGLIKVPHWKGEEFLVANSDNLYSSNSMKSLIDCNYKQALLDYDRDGLEFDASRVLRFAITKKNEKGFLTDIIEKPNQEQIDASVDKNGIIRVSMNCWKFYYDQIFPYIEACPENPIRKEKEIPSAVLNMVKEHPDSIFTIPLKEHVPDLTSKEDLSSVVEYLKNNKRV